MSNLKNNSQKSSNLQVKKNGQSHSARSSPIRFNDLKINTPSRPRSISPFNARKNDPNNNRTAQNVDKKKTPLNKNLNNNKLPTSTSKSNIASKTKKSNYVASDPQDEPLSKAIIDANTPQGNLNTFIAGTRPKSVPFYDKPVTAESPLPRKLILLSSKCKNCAVLEKSVKQSVVAVLYNYENTSYDSLLALICASLNDKEKVSSVAFVATSKPTGIHLLHLNDLKGMMPSNTPVLKSSKTGKFFKLLFDTYVDMKSADKRLDFLGTQAINSFEPCLKSLSQLLGAPVSLCNDSMGLEPYICANKTTVTNEAGMIGELYYAPDKIRNWSNGTLQTLDLFEKIRMVGKGAFGTAVLYRKKDDNSLVILKEINMTELNSSERVMAMNETKVLKLLNHPNIICYYDTFEENGVLMIEMEYADNGTLAQYLADTSNANEEGLLPERDIISMFSQIVSGIRYMHEQNILHRDLKTANIFLTKDGLVKIGDFGVSKIMDSRNKAANTVLGTPYYISPEICEGKPYNEKSDIWALGCILHEMATRQKTFEGTNLPALVNKIMNGQISPIQGPYSKEFKDLVNQMLARDPDNRPTAHDLEFKHILELRSKYDAENSDANSSLDRSKGTQAASTTRDLDNNKDTRSVLYSYNIPSLSFTLVAGLPAKIQIRQVAAGENHMIAVSMERTVYTWGEGQSGQLGHGNLKACAEPTIVDALKGKSVIMTITVQDIGLHRVFAWGEGQHGKLGLGHDRDAVEPTEVTLNGVTVSAIRCGDDCTVFITDVGNLLACGNNKHNKLGLNERKGFIMMLSNRLKKTEVENRKVPTSVKSVKLVEDVALGRHHTAVLVKTGNILTFGSNKNGQMGTGDNKPRTSPQTVKVLKEYVINALVCGDTYTTVGVESGNLFYWGTRYKPADESPTFSMGDLVANDNSLTSIKPSSLAAAVATVNNTSLLVAHENHKRNPSITSTATLSMNPDLGYATDDPSRTPSCHDLASAVDKPSSATVLRAKSDSVISATEFDLESNASTATFAPDNRLPEILTQPQIIFSVFRSPLKRPDSSTLTTNTPEVNEDGKVTVLSGNSPDLSRMQEDEPVDDYAVILDSVIGFKENLYIHVRTNAPVTNPGINDEEKSKRKKSSIRVKKPNKTKRPNRSMSSNEAGDEYTSSSEVESCDSNAAWVKEMDMSDKYIIRDNESDEESKNIAPGARGRRNEYKNRKENLLSPNKTISNNVRRTSPSRLSAQKSKERNSSASSINSNNNKPSNGSRTAANVRNRAPQRNRESWNVMSTTPVPRVGRSPTRGRERDVNAQLARLQKEKKAMEIKYEDLKLETENRLKNLQGEFEKERQDKEAQLKDEINKLREELNQHQKLVQDSHGKSDSSLKPSRICSIQ